ncbi:MAG TPA: tetratricopeptide repeat protein, partial [Desulfuromonadaceae bacterium]
MDGSTKYGEQLKDTPVSCPETPEACFNLGVSYAGAGEYAAAEECFRRVLVLAPHSLETLLNLGYVLGEQGRYEESRNCYDLVLAQFPACAEARYNRAAHLLRAGDFIAGFADYEARFAAMKTIDQRVYSQPRWDGCPLEGRSILVYCEQGLGDALQFGRYIPLLAAQGARVILEVQPPLVSLLASITG